MLLLQWFLSEAHCLALSLEILLNCVSLQSVPPVKLTAIANQLGFPSCRPTGRGTACRTTWHLPSRYAASVSDSKLTCWPNHFLSISWTGLHLTCLWWTYSSSLWRRDSGGCRKIVGKSSCQKIVIQKCKIWDSKNVKFAVQKFGTPA